MAFDTEIFPKCGLATSVRPENLDNWAITLIYYSKIMKNVTKNIRIFDLTENVVFFSSVRAENLGESVSRPGDLESGVRFFQNIFFPDFPGTFPPHLH